MVDIKEVRASNASLKSLPPGHVSVFFGATSGLAKATLIQLATYLNSPKIYLVGRSKAKLSSLSDELHTINPEATIEIIAAETSLLKQVDSVSEKILQKESKLDLLYMATGYLSLERTFTSEGLDEAGSVRHYSRIRFLYNLLPLLNKAPNPRVLSVLAGGQEGRLFPTDLDLKDNYSFANSMGHYVSMHTLSLEEIAKTNPLITFIHAYPGIVNTGISARFLDSIKGGFGYYLAQIAKVLLLPVLDFFSIPLQKAGEWGLYTATTPRLPSRKFIEESQAGGKGDSFMECSVPNNGVYLVQAYGDAKSDDKVLGPYRKDGMDAKMWKHALEVFDIVSSEH